MGGASGKCEKPSEEEILQAARECQKLYAAFGVPAGVPQAPVTGGHEGKKGLARMRAMTDSNAMNHRREFVRRVGETFAKEMGLKGIPTGGKLEDIVVAMREQVPDPRAPVMSADGKTRVGGGNAKKWGPGEKSQARVVGALSRAINSASAKMGQAAPIDEKAPLSNQVDKAIEVMGGAMSSIMSEYQLIHEPVKKSVKNLRKLLHYLDQNFASIEQKMQADTEGSAGAETGLLRSVHKEITDEIKAHLDILESMLTGTIEKSDNKISLLSKDNEDFKRLAAKIKAHAPADRLGEKIAYALSGLRTVAEAAAVVDKALSELGLSKAEYEKLKTSEDLNRKLDHIIAGKLHSSEGALRDYLKAVDTLRKNQWQHEDIMKSLHKKGAAEEVVHEGGKKLDKRVRARREVRERILRVFVSEMGQALDRFLHAVRGIATLTKSGNGLEITDHIEKFTRAFQTLDIAKKYVYYALSGYDPSVNSRQEREKFLGNAEYILKVIDEINKEGPKFNEHATAAQKEKAKSAFVNFRGMAEALKAMIGIVKSFSDKFATGFQSVATMESPAKKAKTGGEEELTATVAMTEDEEYVGSADIPELTKLSVDFDRVRNELVYGVRLSKIRLNLLKSQGERAHYAQDYMKILPDAIAAAVDEQTEKVGKVLAKLKEPETKPTGGEPLDLLIIELFFDAAGNKKTDAKALTTARQKLESLIKFVKAQHDARVSMYRAAEAADLYMKRFSDGLAAEPDSVNNVVRAMEVTHLNANWFTETSGDAFAYVFEAFPAWYSGAVAKMSKVGHSKNRDAKHYYQRVRDVTGLDGVAANAAEKADLVDGNKGLPGNPLLSAPLDALPDILKNTTQALSVGALKNIFSTFAVIGDRFGGKKLEDESHMSAIEIYKRLLEYMSVSSYALGLRAGGVASLSDAELQLPSVQGGVPQGLNESVASPSKWVAGVSSAALGAGPGGDPDYQWKTQAAVTLRSVNPALAQKLYTDDFVNTDKLFVLVVKSVVAKVLTAIGAYNLFNRGIDQHGLGYASGLRLVLGGAVGVPKVIPEALELYVRLPLMAEFYRAIFQFEKLDGQDFREISLVPEMDGIFSGLINIIFDKARYVQDGGYSDTDVRLLIEEINKIYLQFKNKQNPTNECFQEFIAEVNRRYGCYKREERIKYLEDRDARYREKFVEPEEMDVDVELPGLSESTIPRPAPSMSFQTRGTGIPGTWKEHKHKIDLDAHQQMVSQLRESVDRIFKHGMDMLASQADLQEPSGALNEIKTGHISFEPMLRARREELKYAKTDKERYEIIVSAINSLGSFSINALSKNLVMFHEVVVAPLNGLMALYVMLRQFKENIDSMHSVYQTLVAQSAAIFAAAPPDNANLLTALATAAGKLGVLVPANPAEVVIHSGRQGLPIASNAVQFSMVKDAAVRLGANNKGGQVYERFAIDQGKLYLALFEHLYAHGASLEKLVEMRLEVAKKDDGTCAVNLHLDHSKLHQHVADTFNAIKMAVDRFRGLIPDTLLSDFETYSNKAGKAGTLYYLEKEFIDTFLQGRVYDVKDGTPPGSVEQRGFDSVVIKVNDLLKYLTRRWDVSAKTIDANATNVMQQEFSDELYQQIFYSSQMPTGAAVTLVKDGEGISKLLFNREVKAKAGIDSGRPWGAYKTVDVLYNISNGLRDDGIRGLLISFNRLVAAYLNIIYDDTARKVYLPALNGFANGAFSKAVLGKQVYDDSAVQDTNMFSDISDNKSAARGILFATLAQAIKQLMTENSAKGDRKEYAEANLAEIPLYVQERYRSSLPIFAKRFALLISRAENLKRMVQALNPEQTDTWTPGMPKRERTVSEQNLTYVLDEIVNGSHTLLQCIQDTLKDLADDPKFLETHSKSIQEYESLNGQTPFMPLSSVLYYLQNNETIYSADLNDRARALRPLAMMGESRFKLQYGTRGILNRESVKLDELPGMVEIMKEHNRSSDDKHHFSEKEVNALVNGHLTLVRYLSDIKNHVQDLCCFAEEKGTHPVRGEQLSHGNVDFIGAGSDLISESAEEKHRMVYQLKVNLAEVIALTESNNKNDQIRKIVASLEKTDKACKILGDRKAHLAYNFIDLNMVPINVHALMREIPLINLYNYAYTHDRLVQELLNLPEPNYNMSSVDPQRDPQPTLGVPRTAKHFLGLMAIDPHRPVSWPEYASFFSQIMRGDLGMEGLGQPKYLAQELYNKALFGEIYPSDDYHSEADAGLGAARARGNRQAVHELQADLSGIDLSAILAGVFRGLFAQGYDKFSFLPVAADLNTKLKALAKEAVNLGDKTSQEASNAIQSALAHAAGDALWAAVTALTADANQQDLLLRVAIMGGLLITRANAHKAITESSVARSNPGSDASVASSGINQLRENALKVLGALPTYTVGNAMAANYPDMPAGAARDADIASVAEILNRVPGMAAILPNVAPVNPGAKTVKGALGDVMSDYFKNTKLPASAARAPETVRAANPNYFPRFGDKLHYLAHAKSESQLMSVPVGQVKPYLVALGKLRFDTHLARNQIWVTNEFRLLRLKLRKEMIWYNEKVVNGYSIAASSLTELFDHAMHKNKTSLIQN